MIMEVLVYWGGGDEGFMSLSYILGSALCKGFSRACCTKCKGYNRHDLLRCLFYLIPKKWVLFDKYQEERQRSITITRSACPIIKRS